MLRKFAAFDVLEATLAPLGGSALRAYAHRHSFTYDPRPGYLYVRSRAISSRTNDNFDTFPAEEIKASYASFIGKPVFVNHNNDNHRRARGVIIDAALHEDRNPDGSPDTWAEVLMEVDAVRFPKLAQAILAGHIDRTSMGTDVAYSLCSFCGNKATTPMEYCAHIPKMKGKRIYRTTASGSKEGVLVSEICHGLKFFENSLLVEEPADPTAFFTGVDDHSSLSATAMIQTPLAPRSPQTPPPSRPVAPKTAGPFDSACSCKGARQIEPHSTKEHSAWAEKAYAEGKTDAWGEPKHQAFDGHGAWNCNNYSCAEHPQSLYDHKPGQAPGWMQAEHDPHKDLTREVGKAFHDQGLTEDAHYLLDQQHDGPSKYSSLSAEAGGIPHQKQPFIEGHWTMHDSTPGPDGKFRASCSCGAEFPARDNHVDAYHDKLEHGSSSNPDYNLERIQQRMLDAQSDVPEHKPTPEERQQQANQEKHYRSWSGTNSDNWALASLNGVYLSMEAKERKPVKEMSEGEVKAFRKHQESGRRWNRQNPAHADNIIAHWNAATPHEKHAGMNWYADAHQLTKHIASDTGHPMHVAAGMMSNYSPQTHWAENMMNAARALRTRKGIGGKGSGVFASSKQKKVANRLMGTEGHDAEHYDHVLTGPKTHAFAHLIHHGGNADPSDPKVVVDRHALSVACGSRARDIDYEMSGLGGKKRYKQVANEYHKAAQHISKHTGVKVEAHQVQAATWLVRQRLNAGEDKKMASYGKISNDAVDKWNDYAGEHHPQAMGKEPGTGYASPKDAPEDVVHSNDLAAEGHHGSLHASVPPTNPRRKDRTGFGRTASNPYLAYGETKAPEDVDTLRDEECPVCGEADAYDGNRCDVCGFDAPPKMFQDPDLDLAKQLDLRKDVMQDEMSDPNGDGFPDVIPGHGGMGDESIPQDPGMVPDPMDVGQQQVNEILENQGPLDPTMLDANGQPIAPPDPMAQDMPMDPNALPMNPDDIATEDPLDPLGQSEPGTPGDAAADLICPACGFQQGATPPQSTDMDETTESISGAEGALCPQCQSAPLMSIQDMDQMTNQMGAGPVNVRAAALAFPIILSGVR